jgi:peptidyl-tRNA hydrolase
MNERIHVLAEQARQYATTRHPVSNIVLACDSYVFEQKFAELIVKEYASEYTKLINGEAVVLPKDREHAEALVRVGMFYLENNK